MINCHAQDKMICPSCNSLTSNVDWYQLSLEKLNLCEVTVWYSRTSNSDLWSFNHIDYGHKEGDIPVGSYEHQNKAWAGKKWSKLFTYGTSNRMPMTVLIR